jgi:hypothetical protein
MVKSPPTTGGALGGKCRGASPNNEDIHWHRHKLCRKFWEVVIPAFPVSIFDEEIFAFDPTQLL